MNDRKELLKNFIEDEELNLEERTAWYVLYKNEFGPFIFEKPEIKDPEGVDGALLEIINQFGDK